MENTDQTAAPLLVLLVEDNLIHQKAAIEMLTRMGHEVVVVKSGNDSITAYDKKSFDLILMDAVLPETNGIDAAIKIRENEKSSDRHVPIIIMNTYEVSEERMELGEIDGFIAKPLRYSELEKMVDLRELDKSLRRKREREKIG